MCTDYKLATGIWGESPWCRTIYAVAFLSSATLRSAMLRSAMLRFAVRVCRTFTEGVVPFKPTAYGLHNLLRRNDLLVSRAKVSDQSSNAVMQKLAGILLQQCCCVDKVPVQVCCKCSTDCLQHLHMVLPVMQRLPGYKEEMSYA